jgi:hypothetical protein
MRGILSSRATLCQVCDHPVGRDPDNPSVLMRPNGWRRKGRKADVYPFRSSVVTSPCRLPGELTTGTPASMLRTSLSELLPDMRRVIRGEPMSESKEVTEGSSEASRRLWRSAAWRWVEALNLFLERAYQQADVDTGC